MTLGTARDRSGVCVCDRGTGSALFPLGVRDGEMKVAYRMIILILIMIHVAHHGSGAMPTESSSSSTEHTLNLGKSFAHCTKLVKDNYDIWMAGILSLIMGYVSYKGIDEVIFILEKFKQHCGLDLSRRSRIHKFSRSCV